MGIHDLLPFLRKKIPTVFKSFKNESHLKLAIDTPIFMYKYAYAFGNGKPLCTRMMKFVDELKKANIEPTFIFDGHKIPKKERQKTDYPKPLFSDYEMFKKELIKKNISLYTAKYEAEALCAHLCFQKIVDGILTEDSDVFAYGCKNIILKWGHEPLMINAHDVAENLDLSIEQFQDFCVLLGNDFNQRPKGYGPVKSLQLIKEKKFDDIISSLPEYESMKQTKHIFQTFCYELE
jgi:5'-3' exonuclease